MCFLLFRHIYRAKFTLSLRVKLKLYIVMFNLTDLEYLRPMGYTIGFKQFFPKKTTTVVVF